MQFKVDDLINILEISKKIFQITENKHLKETDEIIKVLNEFKGKELGAFISASQRNNRKTKFDYEVLYDVFLKLKNNQKIELDEKDYFYSYIDKNKELGAIITGDSDAWYKLNNLDIRYYSINDMRFLYRILTGNEIKSEKKNDILNEILNTIYQKKYYSDLDKKYIKRNENI